jgi:hypothetical protein
MEAQQVDELFEEQDAIRLPRFDCVADQPHQLEHRQVGDLEPL